MAKQSLLEPLSYLMGKSLLHNDQLGIRAVACICNELDISGDVIAEVLIKDLKTVGAKFPLDAAMLAHVFLEGLDEAQSIMTAETAIDKAKGV